MNPGNAIFHYTCSHHVADIERERLVRPGLPWTVIDTAWKNRGFGPTGLGAAPRIAWLTDMESPEAEALGLTMNYISCDRTEFRVTVAPHPRIESWAAFVGRYKPNPDWLESLQRSRAPARWFVCPFPLRALSVVQMVPA